MTNNSPDDTKGDREDLTHIISDKKCEALPKIYAYQLLNPGVKDHWIKIGYTTRDVHRRIKEQTTTVGLKYKLLWSHPALYIPKHPKAGTYFHDTDFHHYLAYTKDIPRSAQGKEFFYYKNPHQSEMDFKTFREGLELDADDFVPTPITLRAEQEDAISKTLGYLNAHKGNTQKGVSFLWNAKPRFGKTLTAYHLLLRLLEAGHKLRRVLILTWRPAVIQGWFDDFACHIYHKSDFAFVVSDNNDLLKAPLPKGAHPKSRPLTRDGFLEQYNKGKQKMLAFFSLQDVQGAKVFGGKHDKLEWMRGGWDVIIIDEAHEGVDTERTQDVLYNIHAPLTLHLSGTPFRALAKGDFDAANTYEWGYLDEQIAKHTWSADAPNPYAALPSLSLFCYQISDVLATTLREGTKAREGHADIAFDLNEFFATDDGKFRYEADVNRWLNTLLSGENYPFSTPSSREALRHTLWVLERVDSAKAMQDLLKKHPVFEHYEVILAAGDGTDADGVKPTQKEGPALTRVKNAIKTSDDKGEKGRTITLTVGQLTTGVTIPQWSAVFMLSNLQAPSLYMQAAFRAQNPHRYYLPASEGSKEHQEENAPVAVDKTRAFVFDFDPSRALALFDRIANDLHHGIDAPTRPSASTRPLESSDDSTQRNDNIAQLLNFFPVIARDGAGKMVELNPTQILGLPRQLKAQEVVKASFISNLLFANINQVFASKQDQGIIQKIRLPKNPDNKKKETPLVDECLHLDDAGNVVVDKDEVRQLTGLFDHADYFRTKVQDAPTFDLTQATHKEIQAQVKDTMAFVDEGINKVANKLRLSSKQTKDIKNKIAQRQTKQLKDARQDYKLLECEAIKARDQALSEAKTAPPHEQTLLRQNADEMHRKALKHAKELLDKSTDQALNAQTVAEQITQALVQTKDENTRLDSVSAIREHLRGFARTIPLFLMAYGDEHTTLARFDTLVDPEDFLNITGIRVDEFVTLRDAGYFDAEVFDASVRIFFDQKNALAHYFNVGLDEANAYKADPAPSAPLHCPIDARMHAFDRNKTHANSIFDFIPQQRNNMVFTSPPAVSAHLDQLERMNPTLFSQPDARFLDPYMKSGLYLAEVVRRLNRGLVDVISDPKARIAHIFAHQVYGCAPSRTIQSIAKRFLLDFDTQGIVKVHNLIHFDTEPLAKALSKIKKKTHNAKQQDEISTLLHTLERAFARHTQEATGKQPLMRETLMRKFDAVIGNPPYQEDIEHREESPSIYHHFYTLAEALGERYCLISPGRFLFNAGSTPKAWNDKMLSDPHVKVMAYHQDSAHYFPDTDIKGGVAIVYRDETQEFGAIGTFTAHPELNGIVRKVVNAPDFAPLSDIWVSGTSFRYAPLLAQERPELVARLSGGSMRYLASSVFDTLPELFYDTCPDDGHQYVQILGRGKVEGTSAVRCFKWMRRDYLIDQHPSLERWKVFVPKSNGSGALGEVLSTPLIGAPLIGATETFISFGAFDKEADAKRLLNYIKTKFARALLGALKVTQGNSRDTWAKVPLPNFADTSINWDAPSRALDAALYAKYGLDADEIAFIESKVRVMK